ncbi:MAG: response regulator [Candidatus Tectomicrobia bacterium]|uniref:Response regulator n=1 Tax=Tectimicrobiota bacterium TaxID=2528274 RepID=A0A933GM50_UNCTE|nr:response regulator [Candidatus Tectomicrobia bacterium]
MVNILISNGNKEDVRHLANLLCQEGYEIDIAEDGGELIEKLLSKDYQALILGTEIQGIGGIKAISIVKKINDKLPIITITEDDSLETERLARKEKIFYYLLKPIDESEVLEVLKSAILSQEKSR